MKHLTLEICRTVVFEYIHDILADAEPAPDYSAESEGLAQLGGILTFVQSDSYYPTFEDKSAYLLCSLAGAQHFSNGNKRLAVVVLLAFLIQNDAQIMSVDEDQYRQIMGHFFPLYRWESTPSIHGSHPQFLYNLAILIEDPPAWGTEKFDELKEKVAAIFSIVHRLRSDAHEE